MDRRPRSRKPGIRLIMVGKTGSGKSSTANSVFGKKLFKTATAFGAVTRACQKHSDTVKGREVEIMDCPGLYDTSKTLREACSDIVQAITRMHPGPHAFLYVIRLGRYTEEEYKTYNRLKTLLGQNVVNYMVVVFTGGDMLEGGDNTLEELLHSTAPTRLAKVLSECSQRYVVFNNLARDKRSQVDQLLAEVDQIMKRNDDEPFTCDPHIQREVQKELELSASFSDRGADTESEDEVSEGASRGSLSRFRDVVASDSGVITKLAGMLHRRLTTFFSSTTEEN